METVLNEIVGTMKGLWGVLSNYQVDVDAISKWWSEQYGNLVENGGWNGDSGAMILPILLELFSALMPATTTVTEVLS